MVVSRLLGGHRHDHARLGRAARAAERRDETRAAPSIAERYRLELPPPEAPVPLPLLEPLRPLPGLSPGVALLGAAVPLPPLSPVGLVPLLPVDVPLPPLRPVALPPPLLFVLPLPPLSGVPLAAGLALLAVPGLVAAPGALMLLPPEYDPSGGYVFAPPPDDGMGTRCPFSSMQVLNAAPVMSAQSWLPFEGTSGFVAALCAAAALRFVQLVRAAPSRPLHSYSAGLLVPWVGAVCAAFVPGKHAMAMPVASANAWMTGRCEPCATELRFMSGSLAVDGRARISSDTALSTICARSNRQTISAMRAFCRTSADASSAMTSRLSRPPSVADARRKSREALGYERPQLDCGNIVASSTSVKRSHVKCACA